MLVYYFGNYDNNDLLLTEFITGDYITQRNYFKYSIHEFISYANKPDIIFDMNTYNFYQKYIINPTKIILVPQFNKFNNYPINLDIVSYLIFRSKKEKENFLENYNVDIPNKIIPIFFDKDEFNMDFYEIKKNKPRIYLNGVLSRKIKNIENTLEKLINIPEIEVIWQTNDSTLFNLINTNIKQYRYPKIMSYLENRYQTLNYIYNSDIILIPSYEESFGRLVIEGLYFNKKIIATKGVNAIYDFEDLIDKMIFIIDRNLNNLEQKIEEALKSNFNNYELVKQLIDRYFDLNLVKEFDNTIIEWKVDNNV